MPSHIALFLIRCLMYHTPFRRQNQQREKEGQMFPLWEVEQEEAEAEEGAGARRISTERSSTVRARTR